ncbi:MAG TPA: hypothetical protein VGG38_07070 [Acidimicrobiales bacterium]|jgi:hypothetical protein
MPTNKPRHRWWSHVLAVVRSQNGELVEDVVHRQTVEGDARTDHGPIVDVTSLPEPTVEAPEDLKPGALRRD